MKDMGHILPGSTFDINTWDKSVNASLWIRFVWGATGRSRRFRYHRIGFDGKHSKMLAVRLRGCRLVGIQWKINKA